MAAAAADAPARALSAYQLFVKDLAKGPKSPKGDNTVNFLVRASEEYKNLPEAVLQRYKEQASQLKATVAAQKAQAEEAKRAARKAFEEAKPIRQLKHANAYSNYVSAKFSAARSALSEGAPPQHVMKKLAETWKTMTTEEKQAYGTLKPQAGAAKSH